MKNNNRKGTKMGPDGKTGRETLWGDGKRDGTAKDVNGTGREMNRTYGNTSDANSTSSAHNRRLPSQKPHARSHDQPLIHDDYGIVAM